MRVSTVPIPYQANPVCESPLNKWTFDGRFWPILLKKSVRPNGLIIGW